MKTDNAMQLKAKINSKAKELNVPPQIMFQNYMMECFLERLSKSEYADRFIIKGGVLISSIVGLNNRTTMDIDTTVRNIPLNESEITKIISYVCSVENDDDFFFSLDLSLFVKMMNMKDTARLCLLIMKKSIIQ